LIRLLDPLMVGGGDGTGREGRKTTYDGRFLDPVMVGLGRAGEGRGGEDDDTWGVFSRPGDGEREGRIVSTARSKEEKRAHVCVQH
jgi:hypothetical protein